MQVDYCRPARIIPVLLHSYHRNVARQTISYYIRYQQNGKYV